MIDYNKLGIILSWLLLRPTPDLVEDLREALRPLGDWTAKPARDGKICLEADDLRLLVGPMAGESERPKLLAVLPGGGPRELWGLRTLNQHEDMGRDLVAALHLNMDLEIKKIGAAQSERDPAAMARLFSVIDPLYLKATGSDNAALVAHRVQATGFEPSRLAALHYAANLEGMFGPHITRHEGRDEGGRKLALLLSESSKGLAQAVEALWGPDTRIVSRRWWSAGVEAGCLDALQSGGVYRWRSPTRAASDPRSLLVSVTPEWGPDPYEIGHPFSQGPPHCFVRVGSHLRCALRSALDFGYAVRAVERQIGAAVDQLLRSERWGCGLLSALLASNTHDDEATFLADCLRKANEEL